MGASLCVVLCGDSVLSAAIADSLKTLDRQVVRITPHLPDRPAQIFDLPVRWGTDRVHAEPRQPSDACSVPSGPRFTIDPEDSAKHPQREILSPSEVSHDHLLITPPSHFTPQKVRGLVSEFTRLQRG